MTTQMMACGHAAQGTDGNGDPVCVICVGTNPGAREPATVPDLTGREATCPYCRKTVPSGPSLPFFEYRGPGSRFATNCRNCGYTETAHDPEVMATRVIRKTVIEQGLCTGYEPRTEGLPTDSFYCGCRGWD